MQFELRTMRHPVEPTTLMSYPINFPLLGVQLDILRGKILPNLENARKETTI